MSLGDDHFYALYASQPDAQGTVKTKNEDVVSCICAGIQEVTFNTGEGIGKTLFGLIHIKSTDKTATGFERLDLLTFTDAFGIETQVRINSISNKSGFITITIESPT